MTNEQLVTRIKAGESVGENMAQLYDQVRRFIHAAAWKYRDSGMAEDLEQEGFLALYDAIDGYDAAQGVKFLTYAEYWIRQRIRRYLQENGGSVRLPVHCLDRLQRYKRLCSSFQLEHGREPSEREIAHLMGLTLGQVREIRESACMARVGSLDTPIRGADGGEDTTVGDLVASHADPTGEAVDRVQSAQLCAVLWECVDSLQGQQPAVIRQRYQGGMSLREIGEARAPRRRQYGRSTPRPCGSCASPPGRTDCGPSFQRRNRFIARGCMGMVWGDLTAPGRAAQNGWCCGWMSKKSAGGSTWSCWRECGRALRDRNRMGPDMELKWNYKKVQTLQKEHKFWRMARKTT